MPLNPDIENYVPVRVKATGQIISLPSMKEFNPNLHELYGAPALQHAEESNIVSHEVHMAEPEPSRAQPEEQKPEEQKSEESDFLDGGEEEEGQDEKKVWFQKPKTKEEYVELKKRFHELAKKRAWLQDGDMHDEYYALKKYFIKHEDGP
nr:MAG: hypothetical protein [Podoviridae sp. ctka020]